MTRPDPILVAVPYETTDEYLDTMAVDDQDDAGEVECGRWRNGRLVASCLKAGSEECDWMCPIGPRMRHVRARR